MIKGTLSGNTGETKQVSAVLHYSFASFNSQFTSNGKCKTQITNSSVGLSIDGPTSTSSTQSVSYTVTYTNTTAQQCRIWNYHHAATRFRKQQYVTIT